MVKHRKAIVIHNPKLIRIRNSLRSIIAHAVYNRLIALDALKIPFYEKGNDNLNEFEKIQVAKLYSEEWDLRDALSRSICTCFTCSKNDKDMVYIPELRAWNCIECVNNGMVFIPGEDPCFECNSDYVPCPKCKELYCPKCTTELFRELNEEISKKLGLGFSKEYLLSQFDEDEILSLKGKCSCGYSLV